MKLVKCIVRDIKAEPTAAALKRIDLSGLTVTAVRGRGRKAPSVVVFRGHQYEALAPNTMIDVVAPDDLVDEVVRIVMETARTGEMGDGRIVVMPIERAYTIRTRGID